MAKGSGFDMDASTSEGKAENLRKTSDRSTLDLEDSAGAEVGSSESTATVNDSVGDIGEGDTTDKRPTRQALSKRERLFASISAVALVVAVVCAILYNGAYVPPDAAAKVNGTFIGERRVAAWISQYRTANGLAEDSEFSRYLLSQNKNVTTFRQETINQLALDDLVKQRAVELGMTATEEEAREQLEATKRTLAFDDDTVWADTLDQYGLTEDALLEQYKASLSREAVLEADVERRDASDEELLSYTQKFLAGTTQKHAYRIVFKGDKAYERARECYGRLKALKDDGKLDLDAFMAEARASSDETGVEESGGAYEWSGSNMGDEVKNVISDMEEGGLSEPESVDADDAIEIVFCDEVYQYPSASEFDKMPDDVPEALAVEVSEAASDALWEEDCNSYLGSLIAAAQITYYPVPANAAYNVAL